jgi:hypothetical protein
MPPLTLNFTDGSLSWPATTAWATALNQSLQQLKHQIAAAQGGDRQPDFEFCQQEGDRQVEVFCNPNVWPSAHAAKVLLTVKQAPGLRLRVEVALSQLQDDIQLYLGL